MNPSPTSILVGQLNKMSPVKRRWQPAALGLIFAGLAVCNVPAATFSWNVSSGNWNVAGNWLGGTAPVSNTADNLVSLANGGTTTLTANWIAGTNSTVTVGASNTLNLQAVLQYNGVGSAFLNDGSVQATTTAAALRFGTYSATNNGVIQANAASLLTFWDSQNTVNNGTIQAKTGGTIRMWGSNAITGGILKTEAGGTLLNDASGNPNQTFTLTGVAVTNEGTFTDNQNINGAITAGTITTTLATGTVFTNAVGAVTELKNAGDVVTTSNTSRNSAFNVSSGASFNNAGTLLIQNDATRSGTTTSQSATFTVASSATAFTHTGTIQVIANTTGAGATAAFISAQSITNQGVVQIKGNANSQFASFSVTGAGNDYTQSGVGVRRTILEQGGNLSAADQVLITTGTLGGVGSVTGVTTIGSDAILSAGETYAGGAGAGVLAFNNNLTLSNDSEVKFSLGLNTAASSQVTLAGASGLTLGTNLTLTLTDLTGGNWISGTTYRLFDLASGNISGSLGNFSLAAPSGWTGILSSGAGGTDYIDFTLVAVPEPSAFALLTSGLVAVMVFRRRLRAN